jgi:uncharacterized protein (DUF1499 family)
MFAKRIVFLTSSVLLMALAGCGMGSANLRTADGRLADCNSAPNCVSSLATDEDHRVQPLNYTGSMEAAQKALAKIISASGSGAVVENTPGYLRAEYTSQIFRYVDDVEFLLQEDRVIQVRSSSRVGYYDFGANRKRIEDIRKSFEAVQP